MNSLSLYFQLFNLDRSYENWNWFYFILREEDIFTTWGNPHRSIIRFVPFGEYHCVLENNCGKPQISFRELASIMMKLLQPQYCLTSDLLLWARKSFKVSSHNSWKIQSKTVLGFTWKLDHMVTLFILRLASRNLPGCLVLHGSIQLALDNSRIYIMICYLLKISGYDNLLLHLLWLL